MASQVSQTRSLFVSRQLTHKLSSITFGRDWRILRHGGGGWIRTTDLELMRLVSYRCFTPLYLCGFRPPQLAPFVKTKRFFYKCFPLHSTKFLYIGISKLEGMAPACFRSLISYYMQSLKILSHYFRSSVCSDPQLI